MSAPIRLLDISEPPPATAGDNEPSVLEALTALGIDAEAQAEIVKAFGGQENLAAAVSQLGEQLNMQSGAVAGPSLGEVDEVTDCEAAHRLSEGYSRSVVSNLPTMDPNVAAEVEQQARALAKQSESAGVISGGHHRSKLLPSGVVLHYQEFGSETAPPIVLLHDINECRQAWDEVASGASRGYRVLALDMRGHGETTRSPRRLYGLDDLIEDLHHLVVELSLNGRDWEGRYTRSWVLCGRGTGAAVATAYAARHPGRCSALMLCDYDPAWRKDRLAFYTLQGAVFTTKEQCASALNLMHNLGNDPTRLGSSLLLRTGPVDPADELKGWAFNMDPFFFIPDLTAHNAASLLASSARGAHVRLVHTGVVGGHGRARAGDAPWNSARPTALADALREGGAFDAAGISLADRLVGIDDEHALLTTQLLALADLAGTDQARTKRAAALAAPPPRREPKALTAKAPELSEELAALQSKGEDVAALSALGKADRASLKARLKELGYKSLRARVKLEEELLAL